MSSYPYLHPIRPPHPSSSSMQSTIQTWNMKGRDLVSASNVPAARCVVKISRKGLMDDAGTRSVSSNLALSTGFHIVTVPPGLPWLRRRVANISSLALAGVHDLLQILLSEMSLLFQRYGCSSFSSPLFRRHGRQIWEPWGVCGRL